MYTGTQPKCTKGWKLSSAIKQLSKALLLAIKMCTDFTTDDIWMSTKVCNITSKPSQRIDRCILCFKNSLTLLNISGVNLAKVRSFYMIAHYLQ